MNDNVVDLTPSIPRQWASGALPYEQRDDSARPQLAQNLTRAFRRVSDLGHGWWLFNDGPGSKFLTRVSYEGISFADRVTSTVRDIWLPADHAVSPWEFRFSVQDFLHQFRSLPKRWRLEYEPLTESIISSSAQWQECCFLKSTLIPTYTQSEATVLVASLRCLVISNEINQVSAHWSIRYFRGEDECYLRLTDVERNPMGENSGIQPSVEVWRLNDAPKSLHSIPPNRERLPELLQRTIEIAQRILDRNRPQDWPSLFYALCILSLTSSNIDASLWTTATNRADLELKKALRQLCRLFHLATGNVQPLNSAFDIEHYATMVDDNEQAVEHYQRMHQLWIVNTNGEDGYQESADDLWTNIDFFVHGMVI